MKKVKIDSATLKKASKNTTSATERTKKLVKELNSIDNAVKNLDKTLKKESEKKETIKRKAERKAKERDVKAYAIVAIKKQSNYERRHYMRNFHATEKATVVRHASSHSIDKALEQCLEVMQLNIRYKTSELIKAIASYGPSYGDVVRNAMRKAAKLNLVKIHRVAENERTRCKYEFEKLEKK